PGSTIAARLTVFRHRKRAAVSLFGLNMFSGTWPSRPPPHRTTWTMYAPAAIAVGVPNIDTPATGCAAILRAIRRRHARDAIASAAGETIAAARKKNVL